MLLVMYRRATFAASSLEPEIKMSAVKKYLGDATAYRDAPRITLDEIYWTLRGYTMLQITESVANLVGSSLIFRLNRASR